MPVDPKSKKPAAKADTKLPAKTAKSAAPAAAKSAKKASSVPASKTPKPADAKPVVRLIPKKPAAVEAHAPKVEKAKPAAKTKAKPKASNAPRPIEAVRGGGVPKGMPDPSNTKAYIAWANAQERAVR